MAFASLPALPIGSAKGLPQNVMIALNAIMSNMRKLTGEDTTSNSKAILKSQITAASPASMKLRALSAKGSYLVVTVGSTPVDVVLRADYVRALQDIESLRADVEALHTTITNLVAQLKA